MVWRPSTSARPFSFADEKAYYHPTLTFGHIVGHVLLTMMPVGNLFAAIFSVAPEVFGDFFSWIGRVFDQPLVLLAMRYCPHSLWMK